MLESADDQERRYRRALWVCYPFHMYVNLIDRIIRGAATKYAARTKQTLPEVYAAIKAHIEATSKEHRKGTPQIPYNDELCRIGYLLKNAVANATMFTKPLQQDPTVAAIIQSARKKTLNVFAIGGGPGTELLGLAKHYLTNPTEMPRKLSFTVMDYIGQWSETWRQISDAVETELDEACDDGTAPAIGAFFIQFDVFVPASYDGYAHQIETADIIVFNYLFSENKDNIAGARDALKRLAQFAPEHCAFVVIDRLENNPDFQNAVHAMFQEVLGKNIQMHTYSGTIDPDERKEDFGDLLTLLGIPRVKFFTEYNRDPTAFWFVASKKTTEKK